MFLKSLVTLSVSAAALAVALEEMQACQSVW